MPERSTKDARRQQPELAWEDGRDRRRRERTDRSAGPAVERRRRRRTARTGTGATRERPAGKVSGAAHGGEWMLSHAAWAVSAGFGEAAAPLSRRPAPCLSPGPAAPGRRR